MSERRTTRRYRHMQEMKQYVYDLLKYPQPHDTLIVRIGRLPVSDGYKLPSQRFRDPHAPFFSYPSTPVYSTKHYELLVFLHKLGLRR